MTRPIVPGFGDQPFWIVLIKVVGVFVFLVVMTLFAIVFERKVVGRMQNRIGPNRTGPWGMLQSLADGLKLAFKEEIIPAAGRQAGLLPGADPLGRAGVPGVLGHPVRPGGLDLRPPDAAAADRPAGRRAGRARLLLARRLRHRAVGLGVRLDLPAARWRCARRRR